MGTARGISSNGTLCHNFRMRRRPQLIPWKVAGRLSEEQASADDVVAATGWVFNNETGHTLTLAEFVATGDSEVPVYLQKFDLEGPDDEHRAFVEIGAGIGRMTCAFTRRFGTVYACDLDAGLLERCREAVARFGKVERLQTIEVADGRSLDLPDDTADVAFSYITLQHCDRDDALALVREAMRAVGPGGQIALNFRSWSGTDPFVLPLGALMRGMLRLPVLGKWLLRHRLPTRLAWQANRLDPHQVIGPFRDRLSDVVVWRNPARSAPLWGVGDASPAWFSGINRNHWWLVAKVK
jgi:SAM-dependent methyltransferase